MVVGVRKRLDDDDAPQLIIVDINYSMNYQHTVYYSLTAEYFSDVDSPVKSPIK